MDPLSLRTASNYVNNLLLARGLLRNGMPVDFAALAAPACPTTNEDTTNKPSKSDKKPREENTVQIINLVHDMILRRDRDQETQTSLSTTLADLRASNTTQATQLTRLQASNTDLHRQLETTRAESHAAVAALRSAEASAKALREELTRVKAMLSQVRTQCANDVRRRDVQIQKLKGHLTASQRGASGRVVAASCMVSSVTGCGSSADGRKDVQDAEYSLTQETTEFLTRLSQSMSEENDALIALVKGALQGLRELLGLEAGPVVEGEEDEMVVVVPTSFEVLSADLEFVLGRLQVLLTRDDFVSIGEVHVRDDEIVRLREGWERMEARWREAVDMMKGWQERILNGGETVNAKELGMGLNLGSGLEALHLGQPLVDISSQAVGEADAEEEEAEELPEDSPASGTHRNQVLDDLKHESSRPPSPPVSKALRETSINMTSPSTATARARNIRALQQSHQEDEQENASPEQPLQDQPKLPTSTRTHNKTPSEAGAAPPFSKPSSNSAPSPSAKRQTRPRQSTVRSPFHKHINSLFASSSSPEAAPAPPPHGHHRQTSSLASSKPRTLSRNESGKSTARSHRPTLSTASSITSTSTSSPSKQRVQRQQDRQKQQPTSAQTKSAARAKPSALPALTVNEKLQLAEKEARRVSESSFAAAEEDKDGYDSPEEEEPVVSKSDAEADSGAGGDVIAASLAAVHLDVGNDIVKKTAAKSLPRPATRSIQPRGVIAKGTRRKRKSTLTPKELGELMGVVE